jgi:hypothetical protein
MSEIKIGDDTAPRPEQNITELIAEMMERAKTGEVKIVEISVKWWDTNSEKWSDGDIVRRQMRAAIWYVG